MNCKVDPAPVPNSWLKSLSSETVRSVKGAAFEKRVELSILLTGDGEMKGLNRRYRRKDKTTDVLSFPLLEGRRLKDAPTGTFPLGDVVISVPQARRQASKRGIVLRGELGLLLVHGILHLLGYDHATLSQEKRMFGLQARILKKFK